MSELWIKNRSERDLHKLLHNCEDLFHFYSLSTVHSYNLHHIHFTSFSSYNRYKLNLHLTCFRRGFIAQSVEHCTGIMEVMGSNRLIVEQKPTQNCCGVDLRTCASPIRTETSYISVLFRSRFLFRFVSFR